MAGVPAGLLKTGKPPQGLLGQQDQRGLLGRLLEAYTSAGLPGTFAGPFAAGIAKSMYQAAKLPGDVYAGRVDPSSDEAIGRSADIAGMMTLGAGAIPARALELRSGMRFPKKTPSPPADDIGIDVYHGTAEAFDDFQTGMPGRFAGKRSSKHGVWFTSNPKEAEFFGPNVMPARLSGKYKKLPSFSEIVDARLAKLRKMKYEEGGAADAAREFLDFYEATKSPKVVTDIIGAEINKAKTQGYSGVVFRKAEQIDANIEPGDNYIVFDPKDIRKAGPR